MPASIRQSNDCYWISSSRLSLELNCESFDIEKLTLAGAVRSEAIGRASAWFIRLETAQENAVLRHYYRGGQVARISADRFVWTGIKKSRAMAEFHLLEWMCEQNLPVPEPLGARVVKQGLFYTCDLITREISDTETLSRKLSMAELSEQQWRDVGAAIKRLHEYCVCHSDLNANNILISGAGVVSLIDFDRCKIKGGSHWKNKNLQRLKRSLDKLTLHNKISHFSGANWQSLLDGYQVP